MKSPLARSLLPLLATLALAACSKPEPLSGTYTATCTFKGAYRGGGRADSTWTRQCTITLEPRSDTDVAMRFDTGDAIECYGHAHQSGSMGERKISFPNNDLTCRAKTLPAPAGVAVEQCPMPATFDIVETADKNRKVTLGVKSTLEVADKRACVFAYLEKVTVEGKLVSGGKPVTIEAFQDAGVLLPPPMPSHDLPPPFPLGPRDAGPNVADASARDASTK